MVSDLRAFDLPSWRARVTAVFQDFLRLELPLRDNVAPAGAPDDVIFAALESAGALPAWLRSTPYSSRGIRRRHRFLRRSVAAHCAGPGAGRRCTLGAGVVLLDEPTAQLDVRGEAEIFDRLLTATRQCTTILISHRFSTVRHADRICVLEQGRVVELGTHDELMALSGRYRTMFDLQAQRFQSCRRGGHELCQPGGLMRLGDLPVASELGNNGAPAGSWSRCHRRCLRCGGCASWAIASEPRLMVVSFVLSQLAALPGCAAGVVVDASGQGLSRTSNSGWMQWAAIGLGDVHGRDLVSAHRQQLGCSAAFGTG